MGKTLFVYIFWDLLKYFLLASGALAAIMSFGGLLRPLTRQGLGLAEVITVLANLVPAMSTYSLPVAALFATTLVYGRLASDNELTAMRAGGISHLSAALPGLMLGMIVALMSMVMFFFVVPASIFNVEKVIYSNVARLLATSIERNREFRMDRTGPTLAAQGAVVLPPNPSDPNRQTVVLDSPLIISPVFIAYGDGDRLSVPRTFYTARKATVHIRRIDDADEVEITAQLEGGVSFPRRFEGAVTGGVETTQFGPRRVPSALAEKTKFMDLRRLHMLYSTPENARRVRVVLAEINRLLQQRYVLTLLADQLRSGPADLAGQDGEVHTLVAPGADANLRLRDNDLLVTAPEGRHITFSTARGNAPPSIVVESRAVIIRLTPDDRAGVMEFDLTFDQAEVRSGGSDEVTPRDRFRRSFAVAQPTIVSDIARRSVAEHRANAELPEDLRRRLDRELTVTTNEVYGELNARAAFALSCLVLVMMGVALGMMFRSGHFLSAFAVSVVPAMFCILLTVTGQHTVENVPSRLPPDWQNPLGVGLVLIWTGNAVVSLIAGVLLYRLQRQ